jgi:hypothetical protein
VLNPTKPGAGIRPGNSLGQFTPLIDTTRNPMRSYPRKVAEMASRYTEAIGLVRGFGNLSEYGLPFRWEFAMRGYNHVPHVTLSL